MRGGLSQDEGGSWETICRVSWGLRLMKASGKSWHVACPLPGLGYIPNKPEHAHKQTSHRGRVLSNERLRGQQCYDAPAAGLSSTWNLTQHSFTCLNISTCSLDLSVRWWNEPADNRMTRTCRPKSTFRFKQNTMKGGKEILAGIFIAAASRSGTSSWKISSCSWDSR